MRRWKKAVSFVLVLTLLTQPLLIYTPVNAAIHKNVVFEFQTDSSHTTFDSVSAKLEDYGYHDFEELMSIPEDSQTDYLYSCTYDGSDFTSDLEKINELSYIKNAGLDATMKTDSISEYNDAKISKQWHLNNIGAFNAYDSLKSESAPGQDIVVAVIDTGIDYDHEDLKDNLWVNEKEANGITGKDDDGNGYIDDIYGINLLSSSNLPDDDDGHGTHVSGIIAATANDSVGGIGVAYKTKIMALKAGDSDGNLEFSDIIKALAYAKNNGADIINMSFSSDSTPSSPFSDNLLKVAVDSTSEKCLLVAAAGNGDNFGNGLPTTSSGSFWSSDNYPAAYDSVLGVMASDDSNKLTSFSNFDYTASDGVDYEIAAPGEGIYSTVIEHSMITDVYGRFAGYGNYDSWDGTSMATPIVSAAGAVLKRHLIDKYGDSDKITPDLLKAQLIKATTETASKTYSGKLFSYPKVNLYDAVTTDPKPEVDISSIDIYNSSGSKVTNKSSLSTNETYYLKANLKNQWAQASNINVTLSTDTADSSYVSINSTPSAINILNTYDTASVGSSTNSVLGFQFTTDYQKGTALPLNFTVTYQNAFDTADTKEYTQTSQISVNTMPAATPTTTPTQTPVVTPTAEPTVAPTVAPSATPTVVPSGSDTSSGTTLDTPSRPSITKRSDSTARIEWDAVDNADSYVVYRSQSKNGIYKKITTINSENECKYIDKNVSNGSNYYYKIQAISDSGSNQSALSNSTLFLICKRVSNLTSKKLGTNKYRINWSKYTSANGYMIYYSTKKSSGYKRLSTTSNRIVLNKKALYIKICAYIKSNGNIILGNLKMKKIQ